MIHKQSQTYTLSHMKDIHERADGRYRISGFNPSRDIPHFDELVVLSTGLTRIPLEGYKEKCSTATVLGGRFAKRPLSIDVPLIIGSQQAYPRPFRLALAKASTLVGSCTSVDGDALQEERSYYGKLIYRVEPRFVKAEAIRRVRPDAVELVVRPNVPITADLLPAESKEKSMTPKEILSRAIEAARRAVDGQVPVFVRIPGSRVKEDVRLIAEAGADGVVLEGLQAGVYRSTDGVLNYCRVPLMTAIGLTSEALKEAGLLGEFSVMASGDVKNGADATKALALGADAVEITRSAVVALVGQGGLEGDLQKASESADHEGGAMRVAKLINSMSMEVALLTRSLGKSDVHSLEPEDLNALTTEASAMAGIPLVGSGVIYGR